MKRTKRYEKKNTSAKKKLIPAVAMLTTSAVMLSTATYAWFTMSREVEVTGIKLTATTPQTIEVSLGNGTGGTVEAPTNETKDNDLWMNSVATGSVYDTFGKLIPASSVDGNTLYYTTNAIALGKDVQFDNENSPFKSAMDKLVTAVASNKSAVNGDLSASDDDGYYLDIPVWFRTTSTDAVTLGLEVEIKNSSDDDTKSVLYKAARVAILPETKSAQKVFSETGAKYYKDGKAVATAGATLAASYGDVSAATEATVTGGKVTNPDATTQVATVTASTGTGYGGAVKYYIRVWLEGEDEACWNANAGQDFVINLKFHDLSNK